MWENIFSSLSIYIIWLRLIKTFRMSRFILQDKNGFTYLDMYSRIAFISDSFRTFCASWSENNHSSFSFIIFLLFYSSAKNPNSSLTSSYIISSIISSKVTIPITFFDGSFPFSFKTVVVTTPMWVKPFLKYPSRGPSLS